MTKPIPYINDIDRTLRHASLYKPHLNTQLRLSLKTAGRRGGLAERNYKQYNSMYTYDREVRLDSHGNNGIEGII